MRKWEKTLVYTSAEKRHFQRHIEVSYWVWYFFTFGKIFQCAGHFPYSLWHKWEISYCFQHFWSFTIFSYPRLCFFFYLFNLFFIFMKNITTRLFFRSDWNPGSHRMKCGKIMMPDNPGAIRDTKKQARRCVLETIISVVRISFAFVRRFPSMQSIFTYVLGRM